MFARKPRKSNFSDKEILNLLEEIASVKTHLMSNQRSSVIRQKKKKIWETITANVNSSNGGIERTENGLQEKWKDLRCQALRSVKQQQMTGGILPRKNFPHLELILSIIGDRSDGSHHSEVAGKDKINTRWNGSTPGISTDGPLDEPLQERDVTTELVVDQTVRAPLDELIGQRDGTEPAMDRTSVPVPDVAASSATVPRPVVDVDISWLSSVSMHHLPSSSNVANGSERKGRKWQLVITPETDEEIVLFKQWMMSTIEKNAAKKKVLEAEKSKAILEVEKLKHDLGMWAS
uniref:Myb/SANT-like DNA-binding domain-containing protein n=1 Tax=Eptatretus burgeri TaxID=7764 RepID=A0A8C4X1K9_EPTBU